MTFRPQVFHSYGLPLEKPGFARSLTRPSVFCPYLARARATSPSPRSTTEHQPSVLCVHLSRGGAMKIGGSSAGFGRLISPFMAADNPRSYTGGDAAVGRLRTAAGVGGDGGLDDCEQAAAVVL